STPTIGWMTWCVAIRGRRPNGRPPPNGVGERALPGARGVDDRVRRLTAPRWRRARDVDRVVRSLDDRRLVGQGARDRTVGGRHVHDVHVFLRLGDRDDIL